MAEDHKGATQQAAGVLYLVLFPVQMTLFLTGGNAVFQHANLGNLNLYPIAWLHKRASGRSHARDRTCADQITGFVGYIRLDIFDDLVDRVKHLARIVVLLALAVDIGADIKHLGVGNIIARNQPGPLRG